MGRARKVVGKNVMFEPPFRHAHDEWSKLNAVRCDCLLHNKPLPTAMPEPSEFFMEEYYYNMLTGKINSTDVNDEFYSTFTGHIWGDPRRKLTQSTVMCVVDKLAEEDIVMEQCMSGRVFEFVASYLAKYGIDASQFYITPVYKCCRSDVITGVVTLSQRMQNRWYAPLDLEMSFVKPSYLVLMGASPIKWWYGSTYLLKQIDGVAMDDEYWRHDSVGGRTSYVKEPVKVISMCNPIVSAYGKTEKDTQRALIGLNTLVSCMGVDTAQENDIEHIVVNRLADVEAIRDRINKECVDNLIAIDAEWNGEHPQNVDWYLRTLQISWAPKKSVAIVLNDTDGCCVYSKVDEQKVKQCICDILKEKQIAGHYIDADMEHLVAYGIPILDYFKIPDTAEEYQTLVDSHASCGFDTALAAHAIEETDDFSLTSQYLKYTTAPRYEVELSKWLKAYKSDNKQKKLTGYGPVPDSILCPYGNYDADVTRRLAVILRDKLRSDRFGHNCYIPFWANMRVIPALVTMKNTGIAIDQDLMYRLHKLYSDAYVSLYTELQEYVGLNCENFKTNSSQQKQYFLFSRGKKPDENMNTLGLDPLFSTSKPPVPWEEVVRGGKADTLNASTDKKTLKLLSQRAKNRTFMAYNSDGKHIQLSCERAIQLLLDCSAVNAVLHNVLNISADKLGELRNNLVDSIGGESGGDGEDGLAGTGTAGLAQHICDDGRMRTTFYTTKETGRWSSSRPNLQNIGKTAEETYKSILGDKYVAPLRALFKADPGYLLVSSDFIGAELSAIASLSGDETMLDHVSRSMLPESDPNYYDIHSNIAVLAFHLDCEPTKNSLKKAGLGHYRVLAKSVIFGTLYGRGARAIAKQAEEEGMNTTVDDSQAVINTIFTMYPKLKQFLNSCAAAATSPGWLCNAFNRYRRFNTPYDEKTAAEYGRQAQNFPVQSLVADAVTRVIAALYYRKEEYGIDYKLVLQIHDEVNALVAIKDVATYVKKVLPECMIKSVPIYPRKPDGTLTGAGPYYFGNDVTVCEHWGIALNNDQLKEKYNIIL